MLRTGGRESDWTDWTRKMTQWRRRLGHGKTKVDNQKDLGNRPLHPCWVRLHPASCSAQTWMTSAKTCFWVDLVQDMDGYADMLQTWFFDPVRMKNSQIHWASTKIYVQWIWQFPVPPSRSGHLHGFFSAMPSARSSKEAMASLTEDSEDFTTLEQKINIQRVSTCFNEVV